MNKKAMLLTLAVACAAMMAVPAMASALVSWHKVGGSNTFTVAGNAASLSTTGGETITCNTGVAGTSVTGSGTYENSTTGTINLKFHECRGPLSVSCTTAGEPTRTIATTPLTFHNVMIATNTPGVLITPNHTTNNFAHFVCGGFVNVTVTGNGVIGHIEAACDASPKEVGINFEITGHGKQQFTKVLGTETTYNLKKGEEVAAQKGTGTVKFAEAGTIECTHS